MNGFPMGMGGFFNQNNMCGGREVHDDPNALKEIKSRKIVEFDTHFCIINWDCPGGHEFISFTVKRDENGDFILTYGGERPLKTDEAFLDTLQVIIEDNKLVSLNGHNEYVYGLSPEYQQYWVKATYDSGEKLSFGIPGAPTFPWCLAFRRALCKELVRHGIETMLPPLENRQIARFDLKFHEWPRAITYATIRTQEDPQDERPVHFFKSVWNKETRQSEFNRIITIPEGFYEHITELVEQTDLREYSNGKIDFPNTGDYDTSREEVIGYCAEGISGKQYNTFAIGAEIEPGLREAAGIIRDYFETFFQ